MATGNPAAGPVRHVRRDAIDGSPHATVIAKWQAKRDTFAGFAARVDGVLVCAKILRDLDELASAEGDEVLTLGQVAARSGYSRDHIARLVRAGAIRNAGRPGAPRIRARDVPPAKGGGLPSQVPKATLGIPKRRVAAAILRS